MQVNHKIITVLLSCCLVISMLGLAGCRSGGFTKPDLSKLAFWNGENKLFASKDSTDPPPPARHFDPAPLGGETSPEGEVVDLDGSGLRGKYKNDIEKMRNEIADAAKALGEPIRKPYDLGSLDEGNAASSENEFAAVGNQIKSKLDDFKSSSAASLDAAQNDFKSAMNSASDSLENKFEEAKSTVNNAATQWKEGLPLPTGLSNAKSQIDQSFAAVNKSLNNANEKLLGTQGGFVANPFLNKNQNNNDSQNSFESGLNSAVAKTNDFMATAKNQMASLGGATNSFGASNAAVATPNQDSQAVLAQVAEAKRQIEELKQQIAETARLAAASQPVQQSNPIPIPPLTPNQNFAPGQPLAPIQTGSATNNFAPSPIGHGQPVERVAALPTPGLNNNSFGLSPLASTPSNVLRSSNQPLSPQTSQPLTSGYPSNPQNGFAPFGSSANTSTAPSTASQVNFQTPNKNSMVGTADNISTQSSGFATPVESYVSDIELPAAVLQGSSSYAPGSVHMLKRTN